MDAEIGKRLWRRLWERPVWESLALGGGVALIALVGVSVVALSLRPFPDSASSDRRIHAEAPHSLTEEQLAITPPPPPKVVQPSDDAVPPTVAPPGSPPDMPVPSGPPIWPPPPPAYDMRGAGTGVPGPQQAIRPEPQPTPRRAVPSAPARPMGRDG